MTTSRSLGLMGDLFPGLDCPRVRHPQMNDVVPGDLAECGFKVMTDPSEQVDKVIQLYETMMTRHTMVVEHRGGKSVIIGFRAVDEAREDHEAPRREPEGADRRGAVRRDGPETRDWTDGVLSNIFRELTRPLPPTGTRCGTSLRRRRRRGVGGT